MFYPAEVALFICVLVTWSSLLVLIMADDVGSVGPSCHHYCLCAMPTPSLHSLDLSVAHRVAGPINDLHLMPSLNRS
jgi:hypothetical protein